MFTKTKANIRELLQDESGKLSLVKTILALGMVSCTVFMWKMIVTREITPEYIMIYCAAISGQHFGSKYLDRMGRKDDNGK